MKVKISKKASTALLGVATSLAPSAGKWVTEKINNSIEKREQEKKYANQKHNGIIKYVSILLAIVSVISTIVSIGQSNIVSIITGILAFITFVITLLFCLEIIREKKHNIYQIVFFIGVVLLIVHISF